jgi:hypothetical protein
MRECSRRRRSTDGQGDESGIVPEVENMMAKLRFTMTDRDAL